MFLEDKFVTIKGQFVCRKKLAMWKEEGNESLDKRVAWDWVKYNV